LYFGGLKNATFVYDRTKRVVIVFVVVYLKTLSCRSSMMCQIETKMRARFVCSLKKKHTQLNINDNDNDNDNDKNQKKTRKKRA